MKILICMTGKAWGSETGRLVARLLAENDFRHFHTEYDERGEWRDRTMEGDTDDPKALDGLPMLLLSLDPVKGEYYEMLQIGDSGWNIRSNRPHDLEPILGVRHEPTYRGRTFREMNQDNRKDDDKDEND